MRISILLIWAAIATVGGATFREAGLFLVAGVLAGADALFGWLSDL